MTVTYNRKVLYEWKILCDKKIQELTSSSIEAHDPLFSAYVDQRQAWEEARYLTYMRDTVEDVLNEMQRYKEKLWHEHLKDFQTGTVNQGTLTLYITIHYIFRIFTTISLELLKKEGRINE